MIKSIKKIMRIVLNVLFPSFVKKKAALVEYARAQSFHSMLELENLFVKTHDDLRFDAQWRQRIESSNYYSILTEQLNTGSRLLEVGCGVPYWYWFWKDTQASNINYVGVDLMEKVLLKNKEIFHTEPWLIGKGEKLPFRDGSFDVVASKGVLFQIVQWPEYIAELCRVSNKVVIFNFKGTHGITIANINTSFQYRTPEIKIPLVFISLKDMVGFFKEMPHCEQVTVYLKQVDYTSFGNSPIQIGFAADVIMFLDKKSRDTKKAIVKIKKAKNILEW